MAERADVVIIGAGFGGLGAALELATHGRSVVVCEALRYPGGCASTFTRGGDHHESGATLFAGFADGQLFDSLIREHALPVETRALDPVVTLRSEHGTLAVPGTRTALEAKLAALPDAPRDGLRRFFSRQAKVADALWPLFDDPTLLPPFDLKSLLRHAGRIGRYLAVAPLLGQPLLRVLEADGVAHFAPLRTFVDAVCQITVQCPSSEAEAPLALAALDYFFRGARHVVGGIGELAWALLHAAERRGAIMKMSTRVRSVRREGADFVVTTSRGEIVASQVIANTLPQALMRLAPGIPLSPRVDRLAGEISRGWGAEMRYLAIDGAALGNDEAHHLQLVGDTARPLTDGNHLFCSISPAPQSSDKEARTPDGLRTVTISTHVAAPGDAAQADRVQAAMSHTLALRAPDLVAGTRRSMTGSPRTFARFVGRPDGLVGGAPRRYGLSNYRSLSPRAVAPGLWLVGDSVFPGQSTLACMLGGIRTAFALS